MIATEPTLIVGRDYPVGPAQEQFRYVDCSNRSHRFVRTSDKSPSGIEFVELDEGFTRVRGGVVINSLGNYFRGTRLYVPEEEGGRPSPTLIAEQKRLKEFAEAQAA